MVPCPTLHVSVFVSFPLFPCDKILLVFRFHFFNYSSIPNNLFLISEYLPMQLPNMRAYKSYASMKETGLNQKFRVILLTLENG